MLSYIVIGLTLGFWAGPFPGPMFAVMLVWNAYEL